MQAQSYSSKPNELDMNTQQMNPTQAVENWLVAQLADQLSLDTKTISVTEPLTRYGLDSIDAVTIVGDLEDWLELELPSTLFWDHPTIAQSAHYLAENYDLLEALHSSDNQKEPEPANGKGRGFWGRLGGA